MSAIAETKSAREMKVLPTVFAGSSMTLIAIEWAGTILAEEFFAVFALHHVIVVVVALIAVCFLAVRACHFPETIVAK